MFGHNSSVIVKNSVHASWPCHFSFVIGLKWGFVMLVTVKFLRVSLKTIKFLELWGLKITLPITSAGCRNISHDLEASGSDG